MERESVLEKFPSLLWYHTEAENQIAWQTWAIWNSSTGNNAKNFLQIKG